MELFTMHPFLVAILNHTPSAVIQQGGRVGLFSVPHGKLVAYQKLHLSNQNFQFYCTTIAYHVELNAEPLGAGITAETGRSSQSFLDFEVID